MRFALGMDNREIARRFQPAFPTTNPDFERLGEIAAGLLLQAIEAGRSEAVTYVLEVPLLHERAPEGTRAERCFEGPNDSGSRRTETLLTGARARL